MGTDDKPQNPDDHPAVSAHSETTERVTSSDDGANQGGKKFFIYTWFLLKNAIYPLRHIDTVGFFTMILAGVALLQWRTLEKTDQTLRDQVETSASQQRAWIKLNVIPRSLKFELNSGDATFQYYFKLENVGQSVAKLIRVEAKIITISHKKNPLIDLIPSQRAFCEEGIANRATENMDKNDEGFVLFPGEYYPTTEGDFGGSGNTKKVDIIDSEPYENGKSMGPFFTPYLIGCVTYKLNLGEKRHETGFIYEIVRTDSSNGRRIPMGIKIGSDIEPPDLGFIPWYFGSGKID